MKFIDLNRQYAEIKESIDSAIGRVLNHGQFIFGPEVGELEQALAKYVGVRHCISVASGTDSLVIAMRALEIGPGDEVITVPFTFISTAQSIRQLGATPVFVDITPDHFLLDPEKLEEAITPKTKAIMPVSLFGQMYDVERVQQIADHYGIAVIEDGAQSFGASRNGKKSCGVGRIGSTSFFPAKPLACYGDGGALFTDDDQLAHKIRMIRNHGGIRRDHYDMLGTNSRLDTIQAAVLLQKLKIFPSELQAREQIAARYGKLLANWCRTPSCAPCNEHVWAQYTICSSQREEIVESLRAAKIPYAIYYPLCLHQQPAFADLRYEEGSFPVAEAVAHEVLSLPMHPRLTEEEQERIVQAVTASCASTARSCM